MSISGGGICQQYSFLFFLEQDFGKNVKSLRQIFVVTGSDRTSNLNTNKMVHSSSAEVS